LKGLSIHSFLEHPYEEYIHAWASIFEGTKEFSKFKSKSLLWLPKEPSSQPYLYIYVDNHGVYEAFTRSPSFEKVNVKIEIKYMEGTTKEIFIFKELYRSSAEFSNFAENWGEGYIKYHFPKHVLQKVISETAFKNNNFTFQVSESELLKSTIFSFQNSSGEIEKKLISQITISEEVEHLGIKLIKTDDDIETKLLKIETTDEITSLFSFNKKLKPIVDLILNLSSFAERRRLYWSASQCKTDGFYLRLYNCKKGFEFDKKVVRLISDIVFEDFLKSSLQTIQFNDMNYYNKILTLLNHSRKYPIEARIISLNTLLEIILKKNFKQKKDDKKEELIKKLGIIIFDLSSIKDLVDLRNDITHGDEVSSKKLFFLSRQWTILLERIILNELKWTDLSMTDVSYGSGKPIGLV
jgi:hypothetical protein